MKKILNLSKYLLLPLFIGLLLITILTYFNIINSKINNILKIIITLLSIFICSYKLGKTTKRKGYLSGLLLGLIFLTIIIFINIIFFREFKLTIIIIYSIYLFTSILGSMIGKSRNITCNN